MKRILFLIANGHILKTYLAVTMKIHFTYTGRKSSFFFIGKK